MRFYVLGGKTGWIGQKVCRYLKEKDIDHTPSDRRMQDTDGIIKDLALKEITHVLILAGLTGRPNIDWCEDNKQKVINTNVTGVLNVIHLCHSMHIHVTYLGTGCIYQYDQDHPIGGKTYTEKDTPNFKGSFYSKTKAMVEELIREYDNVLTLRIRMPISTDIGETRSFVSKILGYEKIINIPNSVSVLRDLLPILVDMAQKEHTGIYNFVNPGTISHNEIMELYKKYVVPSHTWENFTVEEQNQILKAERSNCELDASKLLGLYPNIPTAMESVECIFQSPLNRSLLGIIPVERSWVKYDILGLDYM